MPKAPNQKYKLFYILELLRSESDEKHPVTMPQIISYLKQNGIHAERKSVYSDMEALQILGYDVVCQKNPAGYYLGSREFELAELKLLVDAVQASKFITQKQSRNLIEKLEHFTSRHEANRLQRQVCVNDRVKTENLSSLYLIDDIHQAMHGYFCLLRMESEQGTCAAARWRTLSCFSMDAYVGRRKLLSAGV